MVKSVFLRCVVGAALVVGVLSFAGVFGVSGGAQAQVRTDDDRFFMLRDPFRPGPRSPFSTQPRTPAPVQQADQPSPGQAGGTIYGSGALADRHRETQATEYVVVMGDSLANQLAQGLADAFVEERPEVAIVTKARGSSGLVRADFYDWPAEAPGLLTEENPTAIVVMLGTNDRQVLRDDSGPHEVRSDRWRELYVNRVDAMINEVKKKGVQIFVVGLPAMRLSRLSADLEYINEILRERAYALGVVYVDVWDGFVDDAGEYMEFGPALDGQRRRLRMGDGVHFSRVGARKLAHYVERDLVRLFNQLGPRRPLISPGGPEVGPSGRPIAGPVLPLTHPAGPVGPLAGAAKPAETNGNLVATRVLVEGLPLEPVAGRADDFRWPRTEVKIKPPEPQAVALPLADVPAVGELPQDQKGTPSVRPAASTQRVVPAPKGARAR